MIEQEKAVLDYHVKTWRHEVARLQALIAEATGEAAATQEPFGYVLVTGHGSTFSKEKPKCEIDFWKPVYLAAPPAQPLEQWQPIETAPKDGTRIIIFLGSPWARIVTARWFDLWRNWQEGDFPEDRDEYCGIGSQVPTHWMPLPAVPAILKAAGGAA